MLNSYARQWLRLLLTMTVVSTLAWMILILFIPFIFREPIHLDMLVYFLGRRYSQARLVMIYDLHRGLSAPLLRNAEFRNFRFNVDGRLAFTSAHEGNDEIYILDTTLVDSVPINISQNPNTDDYPLGWSPDGRYLAFESHQAENNRRLYVWDGETTVDITPADLPHMVDSFWVTWSFDGRIAITAFYRNDSPDDPNGSDVYIWDGTTHTNLVQTPISSEGVHVWNHDGQLAFSVFQDNNYDIYIWDGVSFENGSPDNTTFVQVAPEISKYPARANWLHDGHLAFAGTSAQDTTAQIYVWDGQTATNISQNPTLHHSGISQSNDGRWAYVNFFSSQQFVYVRDAYNQPLFTVVGESAAWSPSGYLSFCARDSSDWALFIWDGQQINQIYHGNVIGIQWQGGTTTACSSG
jgi:hypothetical protein